MIAPESLADHVWLTTSEAARYTKFAEVTIRRLAADGTIKSTQSGRGRGRRYRREWLDEWLEAGTSHPRRKRAAS